MPGRLSPKDWVIILAVLAFPLVAGLGLVACRQSSSQLPQPSAEATGEKLCAVPISYEGPSGSTSPPIICPNTRAGDITVTLSGIVAVENEGKSEADIRQSSISFDVDDKRCDPKHQSPGQNCYYHAQSQGGTENLPRVSLSVQTETRGGNVVGRLRFGSCVSANGRQVDCHFELGAMMTVTMR